VLRVITILAIAIGAMLLLFAAVLYFMQPWMLFHPTRALMTTPAELGLKYDDVRIPVSSDESIHAWYFSRSDSAVTILFCHGNAGNISHRLGTAQYFLSLGFNVLLFDYRGYGESDGNPSEAALYADGTAAYRWLTESRKIPAEQIVLFGRSLGGAVAVDLAARLPARALVLESTFSSVSDMARHLFPFLPMSLLLRFELDSESKIDSVTMPILVVHSPADDIVPYEFGVKLFEAAPEPKTFLEISGGHNDRDYLETKAYRTALLTVTSVKTGQ